MLRQRLEEIDRLSRDDNFSHVARMVSIRKEVAAALIELDRVPPAQVVARVGAEGPTQVEVAAKNAAHAAHEVASGSKTGNAIPPKNTPAAGAPAK